MFTIDTDLPLPISQAFALALAEEVKNIDSKAVTINFRDPDYSPQTGGFHPVEIRLEKGTDQWQLCYITDFCYVGHQGQWELVKELDFDFSCGVFQSISGLLVIEAATELYPIWEQNFLCYWQELEVFNVSTSTD
ncbi:MAG: DUF2787 domain-containing protein [Shewanella sp.]|uniref:DUF2787 family protein n=1 Tax=Shewanella sp. TaxID=50422 RepID=UPI0026499853|nr:DUF2787 family protein [Shewanella sp.]MDN5502120.1 DUF2787 domain-containing protein [Shewanella sp.]MDN5530046.1 DUF2787 domain-containing protein [Shewanella sp.]